MHSKPSRDLPVARAKRRTAALAALVEAASRAARSLLCSRPASLLRYNAERWLLVTLPVRLAEALLVTGGPDEESARSGRLKCGVARAASL